MHVCLKLSIGVTQMVLVWKRGVAGGGSEFCKLLRPGNNGREKPRPEQGPALPGTPARAHGSRARRGRWALSCSRPGAPAPEPLPRPCSRGRAPRCTRAHNVPETRSPPVSGGSPARPGRPFFESTEGNKVLGAVGGPGFSLLSRRSMGEGRGDTGAGQHRHRHPRERAVVDTDCSLISHALHQPHPPRSRGGVGASAPSRQAAASLAALPGATAIQNSTCRLEKH